MERYAIPLLKALAFLSDEPSERHIVTGKVMLPDQTMIQLALNKKNQCAVIMLDTMPENQREEELSSNITLHFMQGSKTLSGIVINDMYAFKEDWLKKGGLNSILPVLSRFAR